MTGDGIATRPVTERAPPAPLEHGGEKHRAGLSILDMCHGHPCWPRRRNVRTAHARWRIGRIISVMMSVLPDRERESHRIALDHPPPPATSVW